MKNIIKISMIVGLVSGLVQAEEMKRYNVKSAKIEYEIKGSGDVMGMMKTKTVGKKRLIFDNYGMKELEEESKVSKETTMGKTKVNKTHHLKYMNESIIYSVNFKKKEIMRNHNSGMAMASMMSGGKNLTDAGEEMLKKMGGKKIGTDKVAGHTCDVWKMSGVKQCLYKGIPLKVESNIMGIKSVEIATKAEFDLSLKEDDFKLPDYPVFDVDMDAMMAGKKPKKLDKSKLDEMDKKANEKSKEKAKEGATALKGMGAGIEAAKKAGYDPKSGKDMNSAQEEAMKKAMMAAMGGEKSMLAKEKKEILEDFKDIPKAKECFSKASSAKEANACERMLDGDDAMVHKEWNAKSKSKLLEKISAFEKMKPCIEKAQTFKALEVCFPKN